MPKDAQKSRANKKMRRSVKWKATAPLKRKNEAGYHAGANKYTDFAIKKFGTYPNNCTIGIELCHGDLTGKFNDDTLAAARELIVHLLDKFTLDMPDVCRHFDVTGKDCPRYSVPHEDEWLKFLGTI
jgi:N-acetylmuramoyl-L-alanine amidase